MANLSKDRDAKLWIFRRVSPKIAKPPKSSNCICCSCTHDLNCILCWAWYVTKPFLLVPEHYKKTSDKGKPVERQGRKTMGLKACICPRLPGYRKSMCAPERLILAAFQTEVARRTCLTTSAVRKKECDETSLPAYFVFW